MSITRRLEYIKDRIEEEHLREHQPDGDADLLFLFDKLVEIREGIKELGNDYKHSMSCGFDGRDCRHLAADIFNLYFPDEHSEDYNARWDAFWENDKLKEGEDKF